jgi:hypothetical protein
MSAPDTRHQALYWVALDKLTPGDTPLLENIAHAIAAAVEVGLRRAGFDDDPTKRLFGRCPQLGLHPSHIWWDEPYNRPTNGRLMQTGGAATTRRVQWRSAALPAGIRAKPPQLGSRPTVERPVERGLRAPLSQHRIRESARRSQETSSTSVGTASTTRTSPEGLKLSRGDSPAGVSLRVSQKRAALRRSPRQPERGVGHPRIWGC